MSDEGFAVQWSVSLPPAAQYAKGDMLNIRGGSVEEVEGLFDEILRDKFIDKASEVAAFLRAAQVVTETPAPAASSRPTTSTSVGYQPPDHQTGPAANGGHFCPHGQRTYRSGNGRTGAWEGYFCPLQKGDPNQCKPEFVDSK